MMFNRHIALAAMLGTGLAAAPAVASTAAMPVEPLGCGEGTYRRTGGGKHKLPRHGQKLKSCRDKISRRVKRKHRRAA